LYPREFGANLALKQHRQEAALCMRDIERILKKGRPFAKAKLLLHGKMKLDLQNPSKINK